LVDMFEAEFEVSISQSRVSDILREEGVATPGGRHYPPQEEETLPVERAGVFFPSERGGAYGRAGKGHAGDSGAEGELSGT
jgi:hypothetical protein